MIKVDVLQSDISIMQPILDQNFGTDTFIIDRTIDPVTGFKNYFLTCDDSVPQNIVEQAVQAVNDNHMELLRNKKVRSFEKIKTLISYALSELDKNKVSDLEIAEANYWLNNQSEPVPSCVMYIVLKDNVSTQVAAQTIVDSKIIYDENVAQLKSLQTNYQNQMIDANLQTFKALTDAAMAQINNFLN